MKIKRITLLHYNVLKFIIDYQRSQHIAPTGWEIADATFNGKSNASMIVTRLKRDGWIAKESNSPAHLYKLLRDMPDKPVSFESEEDVDDILERLKVIEDRLNITQYKENE